MRYTKNDIPKMSITAFLDALGEKPVKVYVDLKLYYAPHRDDVEPMYGVHPFFTHIIIEPQN
ncbi:MAG: hypothetical protein NC039_08340 [Muribaculaceae bacterium]|nr:hypothetical protein [Muribaculaceae bacterium]